MKKQFYKLILCFVAIALMGCEDDDELTNVEVGLPQNVEVDFRLTQDNSGLVTLTPTAEGASAFTVDFGDGSEPVVDIKQGESIDHIYEEGNFQVEVTAFNVKGESTSVTQELVVSFLPPENLEVTITKDPTDPLKITVEAQADNAAGFEVLFGDETEGEEPTPMMIDEVLEHTYQDVGTFTVTVTALSGGAATTSISEDVEIFDPLLFPIDFESSTVDYTFFNFGGGEGNGAPVIDNPDPSGINDSPKVASYTKPSGSEVWAGTSTTLNEPIDFSTTTTVAMDVWSPAAGTPILFKVENSEDNTLFSEIEVNTTAANQWETLEFTLPNIDQSVDYDVIAIFFNFNTSGTGETYFFDNLRTTQPFEINFPLDFEGNPIAYPFSDFGDAQTSVIANPDQSGENMSAQVASTLRPQGAPNFAGTFIDLENPVDFSVSTQISLKVWSPVPNTTVTLKFEEIGNSSNSVEQSTTTTLDSAWETVTIDFSSFGSSLTVFNRMVVFFNLGQDGAGNQYFFDDVNYGSFNVQDFEGAEPTFTVFGNIDPTEVVANPNPTGVNTTAQTAKLTKTAGSEVWAGTFFELSEPLDLDSFSKISVKTHAPITGAVVKLKIESQLGDNGGTTHEVDITNTVANNWEELVYDFSAAPPADYVRIVIFFDFGNAGDGSEYFFDEIKLVN
ncbi:hypothetical protein [Flavobacteriaceae bacterium 14752]|uniref:hypothetical protein n=1 Tax=Mesohalobacter salilacus TaxID=2491711 RepID=UPI000F6367BF|nr:hypothetical protein EIG84_12775 [Flavobacteriaceae bacterium 14752]